MVKKIGKRKKIKNPIANNSKKVNNATTGQLLNSYASGFLFSIYMCVYIFFLHWWVKEVELKYLFREV